MESLFTNEVRAIVADTYLSYTSDIDGAEAFKRFISRPASLLDVKRDPILIKKTILINMIFRIYSLSSVLKTIIS